MNHKRFPGFVVLLLVFGFQSAVRGQGGQAAYTFLQIPSNAKSAALSGFLISHPGKINQISDNPALLDSTAQNISFNYANYVADINGGSVYFHPHEELKNYAFSIRYFNYGNFLETNASGDITGGFSAGDYALSGYRVFPVTDKLRIGTAANIAVSTYPQSQSVGLGVDGGVYYELPEKEWSFGLVAKNLGNQVITHSGNREWFPFEVQLAVSKRVAKAPFRLHFLLHNLQKWDLTYFEDDSDVEIDPITGERREKVFTLDKLMRHFAVGAEFIPSSNFHLRAGYHHQRNRQMDLQARTGMAGFSVGAGFRISKLTIDYGLLGYHLGGTMHLFSVNTKI